MKDSTLLYPPLWTAQITPFDEGGSKVDYEALERSLLRQEASENGILLFGTTGEGMSLTPQERRELLEFVVALKLRSKIMVNVAGYDLGAALDWISFCNDLPIDGYLLMTPIYHRPGIYGQTLWFEQLLERANHPAMIYNNPGRAGILLHPETVGHLRDHERFVAIKDSSGTTENFFNYRRFADEIAIFCGDDHMTATMVQEGAVGLISVISNSWPIAVRRYLDYLLCGGRVRSKIFWEAGEALSVAVNPLPIKALMKERGIIPHATVRLPLSLDDLPPCRKLIDLHAKIEVWSEEGVVIT